MAVCTGEELQSVAWKVATDAKPDVDEAELAAGPGVAGPGVAGPEAAGDGEEAADGG